MSYHSITRQPCNKGRLLGFTLVEMVVTLIVLSTFILTVGVVYAKFSYLFKVNQSLSLSAVAERDVRMLFEQSLMQAHPELLTLHENETRSCISFYPVKGEVAYLGTINGGDVAFSTTPPLPGWIIRSDVQNQSLTLTSVEPVDEAYRLRLSAVPVDEEVWQLYDPSDVQAMCYDALLEGLYHLKGVGALPLLDVALTEREKWMGQLVLGEMRIITIADGARVSFTAQHPPFSNAMTIEQWVTLP